MSARRALILGCHGGVGRALLAVLDRTAAGRRLVSGLNGIVLADAAPAPDPVELRGAVLVPPVTVRSADDLARLIVAHGITEVIDASSLDTVDCTEICDELGAHFLCTSVEEWPERGPLPTDEAIRQLLPPRRPRLARRAHLVGSGANPGLVNALVFVAVEELAARVGVQPTMTALDLYAVLITEEDTTAAHDEVPDEVPDQVPDDVFAMTWSPFHCLEELFEPVAFAAAGGQTVDLGHAPTERWYEARCGDAIIEGMAVPHEEVVTLAHRCGAVELGFVYRLPPAARCALQAHPAPLPPDRWKTRRLWPPWTPQLTGRDRVGVTLCSRRFGELWMGFDTDVASGLRLGTNATQLQVAAGVLAGWAQLGRRTGIHFVEDLDCRAFVRAASEILGPPVVVHDAAAPLASLAARTSRALSGCR